MVRSGDGAEKCQEIELVEEREKRARSEGARATVESGGRRFTLAGMRDAIFICGFAFYDRDRAFLYIVLQEVRLFVSTVLHLGVATKVNYNVHGRHTSWFLLESVIEPH